MTNNEPPELAKIAAVQEHSQLIGEFLEWLQYKKKIEFCKPHYHDKECEKIGCRLRDGEFLPTSFKIQELLAEFFSIDLKKAEEEKRQLLKELRGEGKNSANLQRT